MEDESGITSTKPTERRNISNNLFDKKKIEMITYLTDREIPRISTVSTIIKDENKLRKKLEIEGNIFAEHLDRILVLRTSRNGWRAEQAERIIKEIIEKEESQSGLGNRLKGFFR